VLAFSYAGLPESDGLIISILYGAANLMIGAVGGTVWIASGYRWGPVKTVASQRRLAPLSSEEPATKRDFR
jgi:hypothetical protein